MKCLVLQELKSGLIIFQRVTNETKCVTNQLLAHLVRPGSIIITDEGGAFNDIESLCDEEGKSMEYQHKTVCHSGNTTRVATGHNNIEGFV